MDIKNLKRDVATIEAGQWVKDIPGMGNLELRVRGMTNKLYMADNQRRARAIPSEGRGRDGSLTVDSATNILGESLAATVLLEWRNLEDGGVAVPYDKAMATEWLTSPEFTQFRDAVVYAANVVDIGREAANKAIEKN
jgi:hypothetical protein